MLLTALTQKKVVEVEKIEKKSYSSVTLDQLFGYSYGVKSGWGWLSATKAWDYYSTVSVVYSASNIFSREFASIQPALISRKNEEDVIEEENGSPISKVLTLLENPNYDKEGSEFREAMSLHYTVTGNIYLRIVANDENAEPGELFLEQPQDVTIDVDGEGLPISYQINSQGLSRRYNKFIDGSTNRVRFLTQDGKNELYHIRNFNPFYIGSGYGLSPLAPLYYEIEQFLQSSIHNATLLKSGARPSGAFILDRDISDEGYERLRSQIKTYYSGSENSGNVLILENGKDFKQLSVSNKDMDFATLKNSVKSQIMENLGIPKAFYSENVMTYSNLEESKYFLYDFGILPFANRLYAELTKALLPRYKGGEDYELGYIEADIPALEARNNIEIERKINSKIYSDNAIYDMFKDSHLKYEGGDIVYKPSNLVPAGSQVEVMENEKSAYSEFKNIMQKQVDADGKRLYDDKTIDRIAIKEGLDANG